MKDGIAGFIAGIMFMGCIMCPIMYAFGLERGIGQELCKPAEYDHWIDTHNLICKNSDGTLELKHQ